eukprot:5007314-Pleurochrysis_carterae.AAC.2
MDMVPAAAQPMPQHVEDPSSPAACSQAASAALPPRVLDCVPDPALAAWSRAQGKLPEQFATRAGIGMTPPPATSSFIVEDDGNCNPRYMRLTLNQARDARAWFGRSPPSESAVLAAAPQQQFPCKDERCRTCATEEFPFAFKEGPFAFPSSLQQKNTSTFRATLRTSVCSVAAGEPRGGRSERVGNPARRRRAGAQPSSLSRWSHLIVLCGIRWPALICSREPQPLPPLTSHPPLIHSAAAAATPAASARAAAAASAEAAAAASAEAAAAAVAARRHCARWSRELHARSGFSLSH